MDFTYEKLPPWDDYKADIRSITIDDGATSIGGSAFRDFASLDSVRIATSVTSIGGSAFSQCPSLASIEIPASVTTIKSHAFDSCSKLATVAFAENSQLRSIGDEAFYGCSSLASVGIPASVTAIGDSVFSECTKLASVAFAEGSQLDSIGSDAFLGCSSLASVEIPTSVTSIEQNAFHQCSSLKSATFAEGSQLGSISLGLFSDCSKLASVVIPASVGSIGNYAFQSCSSLTSVEIPASVTSIGIHAFNGCLGLTGVSVPSNVTSLGKGAFFSCSSLQAVILNGEDVELGEYCFDGMPEGSVVYVASDTMLELLKGNEKGYLNPNCTSVLCFISGATVEVAPATYTGKKLRPSVTVKLGGELLTKGVDYKLVWADNVNAGTAKVTAQGIGDYVGYASQPFTIKPASIAGASIVLDKRSFTYDGKVKKPKVKTVGGKALKAGTDYKAVYSTARPKNAGAYTVAVKGKGNYRGTSAKATYRIAKAAQPMRAKAKAQTVAAAKLAKSKVTLKKVVTFTKKAKGKVTYARLVKGSSKCLTVNTKTGAVTVAKGTEAGSYQVRLKLTAAGTANYKKDSQIVTVKVTVKGKAAKAVQVPAAEIASAASSPKLAAASVG